jgi:hypothetical protein
MGSSLACPVPDIVVNIDQLKKKRRVVFEARRLVEIGLKKGKIEPMAGLRRYIEWMSRGISNQLTFQKFTLHK